MPQTALCGFSVTVKRTVALTHGPRARSGSGSSGKKHSWGCEPTCTIADCSVTVPAQGPLEPPFGRILSQPCTLQRAYAKTKIYQSKSTFLLESHSFLERVLTHVAWQYIRTGQDRVGGVKEDHHRFTDQRKHGPTCKDPIRYFKNTAHSTTRRKLSLLLTNPHW